MGGTRATTDLFPYIVGEGFCFCDASLTFCGTWRACGIKCRPGAVVKLSPARNVPSDEEIPGGMPRSFQLRM